MCPVCGKTFNRQASLKYHLAIHGKEDNLACDKCSEEFQTYKTWQTHESEEHCMITFPLTFPSQVTGHERIHTEDRPYKCQECEKGFTQKQSPEDFEKPIDLIRHIRVHTQGKPFKCDHCSRSFNVKCTLLSHRKIHQSIPSRQEPLLTIQQGLLQTAPRFNPVYNPTEKEQRERQHKCTVCGASFRKGFHLKTHMRGHTGERPYVCYRCIEQLFGSISSSIDRGMFSLHNVSCFQLMHETLCKD